MKNLNTYHKLKPIYEEYSKKNPLMKNTFYNKHKQEIDLFQRVTNNLKPYRTANNKLPNIKNLEAEKQRLQTEISNLSEQFEAVKSERAELTALKQNVDMFLKKTPELQQEQPTHKPSILKKLTEYKKREKQQKEQYQSQHHKDNNPEL